MNAKSDFAQSFDPDTCNLSHGTHRPRTWLPDTAANRPHVDPGYWQTRAARGLSWHRMGRAIKREICR